MAGTAASYLDDIVGSDNGIKGSFAGTDRPFTAGRLSSKDDGRVLREFQGKFLGAGTDVEAGRYNTKKMIVITRDVANLLNQVADEAENELRERVQNANSNVLPSDDPENYVNTLWTTGLKRVAPDGTVQKHMPDIGSYIPDAYATITVKPENLGTTADPNSYISKMNQFRGEGIENVPDIFAPGSTQHLQAASHGLSFGFVRVKSPINKNASIKVGSDGWLKVIRRVLNNTGAIAEEEMLHHFFAQAGVYGFGPFFRKYGVFIGIIPTPHDRLQPFKFFVKSSRTSSDPADIYEVFGATKDLQSAISNHYKDYFVDADNKARGFKGINSAFARFALAVNPIIYNPVTGRDFTPDEVQAIVASPDGVKGKFAYKPQNAGGPDRKGYTTRPMIDANGNALSYDQSGDASNGSCDLRSMGPDVTGNARSIITPDGQVLKAGQHGMYGHKARRYYDVNGRETGHKTYFCSAPISDNHIDTSRGVYRQNGSRGGINGASFNDVLANDEDREAQRALYEDWRENPEKYGTNPWFMDPERGFNGAWGIPAKLKNVKNPAVRARITNTNLGATFQNEQANSWARARASRG